MNTYSSRFCDPRPLVRGLNSFVLTVLLCGVTLTSAQGARSIVWSEDFESGFPSEWFADSGVWQVGIPTSGPSEAKSGVNVAATVLNGNYPETAFTRLVTDFIHVPAASDNPSLRFWQWYSFGGGDAGHVQIKAGTNDWVTLATYTSTPGVWHYPLISLSNYAGQTVRLGFLLSATDCCGGYDGGPGWYIDDVSIVVGPIVFDPHNNPESFELGLGDWASDSGTWEVGIPTSGPPPNPDGRRAHSGTNVAATVLAGGYAESFDSRLISPPFEIPASWENPRLRFWHWYSFGGGDSGSVQIKAGTNDWETLETYISTPGVWHYPLLDLSKYAGQTVQLGFYLRARDCCGGYDGGPGWYIDDVSVVVGPIVFDPHNSPEGFELGLGDWASDSGTWEVGIPTSGPPPNPDGRRAHSGTNVAATVLAGDYAESFDSRLISPPFEISASWENPRLRFWHWYSFGGGDRGSVQIQAGTNDWETLATYTSTPGVWHYPLLDLSPYAGQTVRLGFLLSARDCCGGYDGGPGWYIDDISITNGPLTWDPVHNLESFELGLGNWASDSGTWEVGVPTSGPPPNSHDRRAYSGTNVAATVLAGDYAESFDSRLISPPFKVPAAGLNPRLRFWQWYSFGGGDWGSLQIKPGTNDWTTLAVYSLTPGVWHYPLIDLSAYADQEVRLGFLLSARDCCGGYDGGPGWYIDDVGISVGPIQVHNPEDFESGIGDWSSDQGTWEIGPPTSGPGRAYSGVNVAGTVLAGNYAEVISSRLISPAFVVPQVNARCRFWHWYSFGGGDSGTVQIRDGTNDWATLDTFSGSSVGWFNNAPIDLTAYAGKTVQLGFLFTAIDCCGGYDGGPGWYVDDVCVLGGSLSFTAMAEKAANEESLLTFQARVSGANASSDLRFDLGARPPEGAVIDQHTGVFTWTPTEAQGPGTYRIPVNAVDLGNGGQNACTIVVINVNEVNKPPSLTVTNHTVEAAQPFTLDLCAKDPDIPANALTCALLSGPPGLTIDSDACRLNWTPTLEQLGSSTVTVVVSDQNPDAVNEKQLSATNTFTITVATNTIYSLQLRRVTAGDFEFTIVGARPGSDYVLQSAPFLLYCPPTNYWQDVRSVQPTSARYTFNHTEPQFGLTTNRWYRLRTP